MTLAVDVTIRPRRSSDGHPFSEIQYKFREDDGPEQYALTRLWFPVEDTAHSRTYQAREFIKRRDPAWGAQ